MPELAGSPALDRRSGALASAVLGSAIVLASLAAAAFGLRDVRPIQLEGVLQLLAAVLLVPIASATAAHRRVLSRQVLAGGLAFVSLLSVWIAHEGVQHLLGPIPGDRLVDLVFIVGVLGSLGTGWLGMLAQARQAQRGQRQAAEHDALTGLLNRAGIARRHAALAHGAPAALLMLDLNDLKHINDTGGHTAGDAHLRAAAEALRQALPHGAHLGRWGGDELVALLPGLDEPAALALARRAALVAPPPRPGVEPFAAGAAGAPGGSPFDRAVAQADARMYEHKDAQRDRLTSTRGDAGALDLHDFTRRIEAAETPADVVGLGLGMLRGLLGFGVSVRYAETGTGIGAVAVAGDVPAELSRTLARWRATPGQGIVGRVLAEGRTLWSDDYEASLEAVDAFARAGLKCGIAAPVRDAGRVVGALCLMSFDSWRPVTPRGRRLLEAVALRLGHVLERDRVVEVARRHAEGELLALGVALEARDLETAGHTERVVRLAEAVGRELGLAAEAQDGLRRGAYLHDIGKLAVPDAVLLKPGRLDSLEWAVMRSHAERGFELASRIPSLSPTALEVVLYHHERWDGRGYPRGLAGEAIPLAARAFAVCDVFDALVSDRPYKRAWPRARALAEMRAQAGLQFDPAVVEALLHALGPALAHEAGAAALVAG